MFGHLPLAWAGMYVSVYVCEGLVVAMGVQSCEYCGGACEHMSSIYMLWVAIVCVHMCLCVLHTEWYLV